MVTYSIAKGHHTGITNVQVAGCPEAIDGLGAPEECRASSRPGMFMENFAKIQTLPITESLVECVFIHLLIMVHC